MIIAKGVLRIKGKEKEEEQEEEVEEEGERKKDIRKGQRAEGVIFLDPPI